MNNKNYQNFPNEVINQLRYYVYRLIDPRNGQTVYIGKGKGNRVFDHVKGNIGDDEDSLSEKLFKIYEIKNAGFEVQHVIHRHGMDESTAIEVEAALIDAYPGITNVLNGSGSNDYGTMHVKEIINLYSAKTAEFIHKALIIYINKSVLEYDLYEATRYAWRLNKEKAEKAEVILSVVQGIIKGVFIGEEWLEATKDNFPNRIDAPGRYGFVGKEADEELKKLYLNKKLPEKFRKRGASNPIRYTW